MILMFSLFLLFVIGIFGIKSANFTL